MDVRTFEAHTMRDALKAVKQTFGSDAVILRTENVAEADGGIKLIKITATSSTHESSVGASAYSRTHDRQEEEAHSIQISGIESTLKNLSANVATKDQLELIEGSLDELKLLLLEGQRGAVEKASEGCPTAVKDLERQLRLNCVEDTFIAQLIKFMRDLPGPGVEENDRLRIETEKEYFQNAAIKWALKRIRIAPKWSVMEGSTSVHAFIGATGVGKTSTVAKLASHYKNVEKVRVLIISYDNLRIAASEQLRILSKAMNIHFEMIDHPNQIPSIIEKYDEPELVLIDTAGRSTKSRKQMDELNVLCELPVPIEKHLVLSMSEKQIQMDRSIRYFSNIGVNSLIFSKLDQTWSYGEMFNVMCRWNLPASFFGVGQSVPGDFERASRERVIERIFGL